jgi:outer membrane protein TolC
MPLPGESRRPTSRRLTPRDRRIVCALAVSCFLQATVGCMPVYRPPRKTDFFRVTPTPREQATTAAVQQYVPLLPPISPPEFSGPEGLSTGLGGFGQPPGAGQFLSSPSPGQLAPGQGGAPYPIALEDAVRIGLGNSGVVRVLSGSSVSAAEATLYDADIAEARARVALAAFDPSVTSTLYSNWINQPPDAVFGPGLAEPTRRDEAGFTAALSKPWMTGGETRVGYNPPLGYLWLPYGTSGFNPLYESNIEFTVKQPLLRGAGIAANKAPIRVAQLRRDETVLETRQAAMASVRSVTEAYWDLYAASAALRAIEVVVPLLQRVVTIEQERMNAQRSVRADVAKVQSQLRAVTQQAVAARAEMVQAELRLRNLLGLPPADGYLLTPTSRPVEAPVGIDIDSSTATALELRPDVVRRRLSVRAREQELLAARNLGRPQLDASGIYRWNGVGERLDDSLEQMITTQFADWQTALTFSMPLGRRAAAGAIRAATVQLAREKAMLQQASHSTVHVISSLAREAEYNYQLFTEANARLAANTDWLEGAKIRYENPPPDGDDWLLAATNDYLSALRSQADAASDMQKFLSRYNAALARLNEAMGTILDDYGIQWTGDCGVPTLVGTPPAEIAPHIRPQPAAADYRMRNSAIEPYAPSFNGPSAPPAPPATGISTPPAGTIGPSPGLSSPSSLGVFGLPGSPQPALSAPSGANDLRSKTPAETFFGPAASNLPAAPPMSGAEVLPWPTVSPTTKPAPVLPGVQPPFAPFPAAPSAAPSANSSLGRTPAESFFGASSAGSRIGPPVGVVPTNSKSIGPLASGPTPSRFAPLPAPPLSPTSSSRRTPAERFFGSADNAAAVGKEAITGESDRAKSPAETFFAPPTPASPASGPNFPSYR